MLETIVPLVLEKAAPEKVERFGQTALSSEDVEDIKGKVEATLSSDEPNSVYKAIDQLSHLKRAGVGGSVRLNREKLTQQREQLQQDPQTLAKYLVRMRYLGLMDKKMVAEVSEAEKASIQEHINQRLAKKNTTNFAELCVSAKHLGIEIPSEAQNIIRVETEALARNTNIGVMDHVDHYVKRRAQARYLGIKLADDLRLKATTKIGLAEYYKQKKWDKYARLQALYTRATQQGLPITGDVKDALVEHTKTLMYDPAKVGRYLGDLAIIEKKEALDRGMPVPKSASKPTVAAGAMPEGGKPEAAAPSSATEPVAEGNSEQGQEQLSPADILARRQIVRNKLARLDKNLTGPALSREEKQALWPNEASLKSELKNSKLEAADFQEGDVIVFDDGREVTVRDNGTVKIETVRHNEHTGREYVSEEKIVTKEIFSKDMDLDTIVRYERKEKPSPAKPDEKFSVENLGVLTPAEAESVPPAGAEKGGGSGSEDDKLPLNVPLVEAPPLSAEQRGASLVDKVIGHVKPKTNEAHPRTVPASADELEWLDHADHLLTEVQAKLMENPAALNGLRDTDLSKNIDRFLEDYDKETTERGGTWRPAADSKAWSAEFDLNYLREKPKMLKALIEFWKSSGAGVIQKTEQPVLPVSREESPPAAEQVGQPRQPKPESPPSQKLVESNWKKKRGQRWAELLQARNEETLRNYLEVMRQPVEDEAGPIIAKLAKDGAVFTKENILEQIKTFAGPSGDLWEKKLKRQQTGIKAALTKQRKRGWVFAEEIQARVLADVLAQNKMEAAWEEAADVAVEMGTNEFLSYYEFRALQFKPLRDWRSFWEESKQTEQGGAK